MMIALSLSMAFAGSSAAEGSSAKPRFMGIFKGSYRYSFPQAVVVKRFLVNNGVFAKNAVAIGDAETIQKMSDKIMKDFISKGFESCTAQQYYVIEEVNTVLNYHPDGSHLLHSDANIVCFNTNEPLENVQKL
jgi:hypothetical protein